MAVAPEHAELNDQLNAYLDGELDPPARRRLEAHLVDCAACRQDLDELRLARTALRALPALRAPRPFTITAPAAPRLAAAAAAAAAAAPDRRPAWPWLAWVWRAGSLASAACLLMALLTAGAPLGSTATANKAAPELALPKEAATDRSTAQLAAPGAPAAPAPAGADAPAGRPSGAAPQPRQGAAGFSAPTATPQAVLVAPPSPGVARPTDAAARQGVAAASRSGRAAPAWLALAGALAITSGGAFAAERRARRATADR